MAGHMYVAMIPVKTEGRIKWKNWKWRQEQPGSNGSSSGEGR